LILIHYFHSRSYI